MRSKTLLRATAASIVLAIGVSSLSLASADPVQDRQDTMKDIGQSMKEGASVSSAKFYDAAKAKAAMDKVAADAKKVAALFPAKSGPDVNPKTAALPAIWANMADFNKRL